MQYKGNNYSRFSSNFEASASELLENLVIVIERVMQKGPYERFYNN